MLNKFTGAVLGALSATSAIADNPDMHCVPTLDSLAVLIDGDGVRYVSMVDEATSFMIDPVDDSQDFLSLLDMIDNGFLSIGEGDLYKNITEEFDNENKIAMSELIQNDPSASIMVTDGGVYVSYDGNTIDWGDVVSQSAFVNAYGLEVSDAVNILANTGKTVKYSLDRTDAVCSIKTSTPSEQRLMFSAPPMRPQTP